MTVFTARDYILKAKILPVFLTLSVTVHPIDVSAILVAHTDVSKTDKGDQHKQATHSSLFGELAFRRFYKNVWFGYIILKGNLVWKVLTWLTD